MVLERASESDRKGDVVTTQRVAAEWREVDRRLREYRQHRSPLDAAEAFDLVRAEQLKIYVSCGFVSMCEYMERVLGYRPHTAPECRCEERRRTRSRFAGSMALRSRSGSIPRLVGGCSGLPRCWKQAGLLPRNAGAKARRRTSRGVPAGRSSQPFGQSFGLHPRHQGCERRRRPGDPRPALVTALSDHLQDPGRAVGTLDAGARRGARSPR
jgi:hypothetical protein